MDKKLESKVLNYLANNPRKFEVKLYRYLNGEICKEEVVNELAKYQNKDGGFGNGLESDFRLSESSAMATSIALRYMCLYIKIDRKHSMLKNAIIYLENTFDKERNGWFSVPKEVNNYPHAIWWNYKEEINGSVIDLFWGNPTAEIIGYLNYYKESASKYNWNEKVKDVIKYILDKEKFESEHELCCFIRFYHVLKNTEKQKIRNKIIEGIKELLVVDINEWGNYVPTPMTFLEYYNEDLFDIDKSIIEKNKKYIMDILNKKRIIEPSWNWGQYFEEWEAAKIEWTEVLSIRALLFLFKF